MKFPSLFFFALIVGILSMAFVPDNKNNIGHTSPQHINNQFNAIDCAKFDDLGEAKSDAVSDKYSVYRDRIKEENFKAAYPLWKKVYQTAPKTNGRLDYVFRDGIKIYTAFHNATTDTLLQDKYVDTMMMIYEKAVICFPEKKAYYYSKEGVDMFYKYKGKMSKEDIYFRLKTAAELDKDETRVSTIIPLSSLNFSLNEDEKINNEESRKTLDNINNIVKLNFENCKEDKECNAWAQVEQYTLELSQRFENKKGFYSCDFFMKKYYAEFEAAPDDCAKIEELYRKFQGANCTAENPKMVKLADTYKSNCMKPTTDPDLACGRDNLDADKFKDAIDCYDRYINKTTDMEAKANFSLRVAKIYYLHLRNFPKARTYAKQAADYKSNWGEPYLLIGKLYASSGSLCGPGTGFDSQVVTWPAIDKFMEAKRIDPGVSNEADKLINIYSKYMPSREDVFSRPKVKEGENYQVKCWIQETTRVRIGK
ncbi:MAG: tetratricopeptide repeat protein [Saprospiraceae bacterium]